jgi:predicted ester cyclase
MRHFRWVHDSGEYMGKPPTGNTITFTGMSIDRFKDGKIVEEWLEMDALGMMMQLGFEFK